MNVINSFTGGHSYLSNFHPHTIQHEGINYPTNEHAYQAAKTLEPRLRYDISQLASPHEAKRYGRRIPLRPHWDQYWRYQVMCQLLRNKFSDPQLAQQLASTGNAILIEGNTWGDTTWGTVNGKGHNLLGWMLMKIRDEA